MSAAREYLFDDLLKNAGWEPLFNPSSVRNYENKPVVPDSKSLPFHNFTSGDKTVYSNKPVVIKVLFENNRYTAENETLRIYVVGDTLRQALQEFSQHLVYFYEYYENKETDELIGQAVNLKNLYDNNFTLL